MKSLQHHLTEYVTARRSLGTRLEEPAKTLCQFVSFLAHRKARFITIQLALEWSQQSRPNVQRATWARKLSMVRQFARWMSVIDPRHQVPPRRMLDVRHRRCKPHIYSQEEISRLMAEASRLKSPNGMKALTLATLIGLLAATGLRPGEAAALEQVDVDLESQLLTIRESKFGKSRLVPIHPSTVTALRHYARDRDRVFRHPSSSFFFVSERGTALDLGAVRLWLCKISVACGLRKKAEGNPTPTTGRATGNRGTCPLPWQRAKGPMHTAAVRCGRSTRTLACATASGPNNVGLPNRLRQTHEFGRLSKARSPAHQECGEDVPLLAAKESDAAHAQTHHGDGPSTSWSGHHCDRALVRP